MQKAIGIDPASGKESCIWMDDDYIFVKPQNLRSELEKILKDGTWHHVIAWDAPLSFSESSYSDRLIDKLCRKWVKEKVGAKILENKAINVLPFSGLSHWVISCKSLGYPFGIPLPNTYLAQTVYRFSDSNVVIEVHPAVSMGFMWADSEVDLPFPIYKKSKQARKLIVGTLKFPDVCVESDDILDAYVAYLMATNYISGKSMHILSPVEGSYVLPLGKSFNELHSIISLG